jgi:hypothetical protein
MKKFIFISLLLTLTIILGCKRLSELGSGYKLDYNSMGDISIVKNYQKETEMVMVYGQILDYAFDSTFIIAAEKPRDSIPECNGKVEGITLKQSDEAFAKSTFRQYWIIDKSALPVFDSKTRTYSNVFGPFRKKEYLEKRRELGVPQNLKLKGE